MMVDKNSLVFLIIGENNPELATLRYNFYGFVDIYMTKKGQSYFRDKSRRYYNGRANVKRFILDIICGEIPDFE